MEIMGVTVTLDANDETNPVSGEIIVGKTQTAAYDVVVTGTITVTLQRKINGTNWVAVEAGYTSSVTKHIVAPGAYRLIASGVSGGSAITSLSVVP